MSNQFDFTTYDPRDYAHRARLRAVLWEIETQVNNTMLPYLFTYQQMLLSTTEDRQARHNLLERAHKLLYRIQRTECPWDPWETEDKPQIGEVSEYQNLFNQWKEIWGDPSDPAVQAKIDYTARSLMAQHE